MDELIYVNGSMLKYINTVTYGWYDVSKDSGRDTTNADGTMVLNVINEKRRLDITTKPLNQAEMLEFFAQIKQRPTMSVNFYDPYYADRKVCNMYRGDRVTQLRWKLVNGNIMYEPVTIALIEL